MGQCVDTRRRQHPVTMAGGWLDLPVQADTRLTASHLADETRRSPPRVRCPSAGRLPVRVCLDVGRRPPTGLRRAPTGTGPVAGFEPEPRFIAEARESAADALVVVGLRTGKTAAAVPPVAAHIGSSHDA